MTVQQTEDDGTSYLLGTSDGELDHLVRQADAFAPATRDLLDRIDVRPGWTVADIGCGAMGILHLLAERVGPSGVVVGVDREPRMLDAARKSLSEGGMSAVSLVRADAAQTGLPMASLDLAHARTLLVNVPNPEAIVAELTSLARPGGFVALQEPDCSGWICEPAHPAWDRLHELFLAHYRVQGRDPLIGRRLPGLLRGAGLREIAADVRPTAVTFPGDWYHTQLPHFIGLMRESIVAAGLCGPDEAEAVIAEARTHLDRPGTVTYCPLWHAWGRTPS